MGPAFSCEMDLVYFHAGMRRIIYTNRNVFRDNMFFFLFVIYYAPIKSKDVYLLFVKLYLLFHWLHCRVSYFTTCNKTSLFLYFLKRQKIILNQNLNPCYRKIKFEAFKLKKSFFTMAESPENE
jgi:hypothetical protein